LNIGAVYEAIAPNGKRVAVKVTDLRPDPTKTQAENDADFDHYLRICVQEFDKLWELTKVNKERRAVKVYEIGTDSYRPYGKSRDFAIICTEKRHMYTFCFT
jgi:hypothetical protein